MATTIIQRTPVDMPVPKSSAAPKFTGSYVDVKNFLDHCDRIFDQYNVTLDNDKVRYMVQCCNQESREIIEGLPSHHAKQWERLKTDMLKIFDHARTTQKFTLSTLRAYAFQHSNLSMRSLDDFREYQKQYIRIAGWLLNNNKISKTEYNQYFWLGINESLRPALESKIMVFNPHIDLSSPFSIEDVTKAVEIIFKRDRFDVGIFDNPSARPFTSLIPPKDSYPERSSVFDEIKKYLQEMFPNIETRDARERPYNPPEETKRIFQDLDKEEKQAHKDDEVENLIKQMSKLTIHDSSYAIYYLRAIKLEPALANMLIAPAIMNPSAQPAQPVPIASQSAPPAPRAPRQSTSEIICYGCHQQGHGINNCPTLIDLTNRKLISRDSSNRVVFPDGSRIIRQNGESIAQAVLRQQQPPPPPPPQVATTSIAVSEAYYGQMFKNYRAMVAEEEEDDIGTWDGEDEFEFTLAGPGNRIPTEKRTRAARKQVMDAVVPPEPAYLKGKRAEMSKAKDSSQIPSILKRPANSGLPNNVPSSTSIQPVPIPSINQPSAEMNPSIPVKQAQPNVPIRANPTEHPETAQRHEVFDPADDDQIMEDVTPSLERGKSVTKPRAAPQKRVSDISQTVDTMAILRRCLNQPVNATFGELLGVSKDLRTLLINSIKGKTLTVDEFKASLANGNLKLSDKEVLDIIRSAEKDVPVQYMHETNSVESLRAHEPLLRITLMCNGHELNALIDSGSTQNILSEQAWKKIVKLPMDSRNTIVMVDIHGGKSHMLGFVGNVQLDIGTVRTRAHCYVSDKVQFDILLGRPWTRDNYVDILERPEGTFIAFYDVKDPTREQKFLVTPDTQHDRRYFTDTIYDKTPHTMLAHNDLSLANPDAEEGEIEEDLEPGELLDDLRYPSPTPSMIELSILTRQQSLNRDESANPNEDLSTSQDAPSFSDSNCEHDSTQDSSHGLYASDYDSMYQDDSGTSQFNATAHYGHISTPPYDSTHEAPQIEQPPSPSVNPSIKSHTSDNNDPHEEEPADDDPEMEQLSSPEVEAIQFSSDNTHLTAMGMLNPHLRFEDWILYDATYSSPTRVVSDRTGTAFVHYVYPQRDSHINLTTTPTILHFSRTGISSQSNHSASVSAYPMGQCHSASWTHFIPQSIRSQNASSIPQPHSRSSALPETPLSIMIHQETHVSSTVTANVDEHHRGPKALVHPLRVAHDSPKEPLNEDEEELLIAQNGKEVDHNSSLLPLPITSTMHESRASNMDDGNEWYYQYGEESPFGINNTEEHPLDANTLY
uniref:CCHC-type domain-containing protein n=1 Tax=Psilocybe cubensis TaxID=181762 RepID=A0A8H8CFT3_PSICU